MRYYEFITERKKKGKKAKSYGSYWYPGFAYASDSGEGGGDGGGGESKAPKVLFNPKPKQKGPDEYEYTEYIPRGKEDKEAWAIKRTVDKQKLPQRKPKELNTGFYKNYLGNRPIREEGQDTDELESEVARFVDWAGKKLKLKKVPKVKLSMDTEEAQTGHHTGKHTPGDDYVWVYARNRNLVDILRTVFHELVHVRQHELNMIKPGDSYPGSPIEAQADVLAGKFIKIYGKANRNIFQ